MRDKGRRDEMYRNKREEKERKSRGERDERGANI